jgi:hypothetical protein
MGGGVAFLDYDNDGWSDIFLVNGTTFEGFPPGKEPSNFLFQNNHDGTFADGIQKAGLTHSGWVQGVCVGDYNNDGFDDIFVTYWGNNVLYRNNGVGTFTDVKKQSGLSGTEDSGRRHDTGAPLRPPRCVSRASGDPKDARQRTPDPAGLAAPTCTLPLAHYAA